VKGIRAIDIRKSQTNCLKPVRDEKRRAIPFTREFAGTIRREGPRNPFFVYRRILDS